MEARLYFVSLFISINSLLSWAQDYAVTFPDQDDERTQGLMAIVPMLSYEVWYEPVKLRCTKESPREGV